MSKSRNHIIDLLLIFILVLAYLFFSSTGLSKRLGNAAYDYVISSRAPVTNNDLVMVVIDDHSIQRLQQKWPWPRSYHAALINHLTDADAAVVAYNVIFAERGEEDQLLREAIRRNGRVVLPIDREVNYGQNIFINEANIGHASIESDPDSILRGITIYEDLYGESVPAFALAVLKMVNPIRSAQLERRFGHDTKSYNRQTNFIYSVRDEIPVYSFIDVLERKINPQVFKDKIVFVGVIGTGIGQRFIPADRDKRSWSGTGVQISLFNALNDLAFVKIPHPIWKLFFNFSALFLVVHVVRTPRISIATSNVISLTLALLLTALPYLIFITTSYWINLIDSALIAVLFIFIYTLSSTHYRLREANRSLERHVAKRTQELRVTNYNLAQEIRGREQIERSLRHSEHGLRTLLDNIQIGIITISVDGRIVTANKTIFSLFGHKPREIIGTNLQSFLSCDLLNKQQTGGQIATLIERLISSQEETFQIEGEVRRSDDKPPIPVAINFSQLRQGEKHKFVCLIRDIRDQRRAEKMTQEFVATVSHELRTPITSVKGALELMKAGMAGELSPRMEQMLGLALRNSERLLMLVNDILDIQRIQLGTLKFDQKPLNIVSVVRQSIEVNEVYSEMYRVKLVAKLPDYPLYVMGDEGRLIQVMSNLISNASKFSPSGGAEVVIQTRYHGDRVMVSVTDFGCGISEDFRSQIFGKFEQAGEARHRSKGTGLGLSITKALVERMNGVIDYRSQEGKGSTFYFVLPALTPREVRQYIEKESRRNEEKR